MKKYLLLYISLSFFISPLAWSMAEEDDYESGSDQDEGSEPMQNGMQNMQPNMAFQNGGMMTNQGMMQQPGMLPPNGMMMNQNNFMPMPNNMMMQQPGMMPQNGIMPQNGMMNQGMMPQNRMMTNQMNDPERLRQDDETSKKEYVRSLVQNILKVDNRRRNRDFQDGKGETVTDRNLKNKLFKLQKDLNKISRNLDGITDEEETFAGGSSKKSKSKTSAKTKSSKKSTTASKSSSTKTKSSRKSRSSKYKKYRRKNRTYSRSKKFSKFNRPKSFYTVKQLTPQNAVKYVPRYYYSGYTATVNEQQAASAKAISYKVKNWGTGEVVPEEAYYYKNFQNSYFSNKSKCENGCGTH